MNKIGNLYQKAVNCVEESISQRPNDNIHQALEYWEFTQTEIRVQNWETRRKVLGMFVSDSNKYISVISMIESLPVSIWRRILWRDNINLESCRSFLRRISSDEIEAIRQNYQDLIINKKQPCVLTRFEQWQKRFKVEALLMEEDTSLREEGKGSWSYNLMSLDMGFNAYKNGLDDDIRAQAKTWRDFLSIKNPTNDFIVNQEFGKYWWLYQTARSSYGWMRNQTVQLKSHICPGFWWTIIVHLIFWIFSPVSAVCSGLFYGSLNSWSDLQWAGPLFVLGLVTPLWIISALLWSLIRWILPPNKRTILQDYFKQLYRPIKKYEAIFWIMLAVIIILVIFAFISKAFFDFLSPGFGVLGAIAIIAVFYLYLGNWIVHSCKYSGIPNFEQHHFIFQFIYLLAVTRIVAELFLCYGHLFSKAIIAFWAMFWEALFILGTPGLVIFGLIVLPILLFATASLIDNEKVLNWIIYFTNIAFIVIIVSGFILMLYNITLVIKMMSIFHVSLIAFAWIICMGFSCLMLHSTLNYDPKAKRYNQWFIDSPVSQLRLKLLLNKNHYYQGLSEEQQAELLHRARLVIYPIFSTSCAEVKACKILLPVMSEETINILEELSERFSKLRNSYCSNDLLKIFEMVVSGVKFNEALYRIGGDTNKRDERKKVIFNAIKLLCGPFIFIWKCLKAIFWLIKQTKWVYDKFNEMCPKIKRSGRLNIGYYN